MRKVKLTRHMKMALSKMGHDPADYYLHHIDWDAGAWVFIHKEKGTFVALSM